MYPILLSILRSSFPLSPSPQANRLIIGTAVINTHTVFLDARPVTTTMIAGDGGWRRRDLASGVISPFRGGTIPSGSVESAASCFCAFVLY